jgi:MFS family permease
MGIALRPLVGGLSDRVGRKHLIVLCCLASAASLLVLAASDTLWHFWVFAALGAVSACREAVCSALVTDLVTKESLGVGMSLYSATAWAGGIVGFAVTGQAIQQLGMAPTLSIGALLPVLAIGLLIPMRQAEGKRIVQGV